MKVVILQPKVVDVPEGVEIPAGVMSAVPSVPWELEENIGEGDKVLPDFTISCSGQYLTRELYPELHSEYLSSGGFHQFQLPSLERKFLMGFDQHGPILGDAIVYFQSYPQKVLG